MKLYLLISLALTSVQRIQTDESSLSRDYESDDVDDLTILNAHGIHRSLAEIKDEIQSLTRNAPSNAAALAESLLLDFKSEVQNFFNDSTLNACQSGIEEIRSKYDNLEKEIKESLLNTESKIYSWLDDLKKMLSTNKAPPLDPRCRNLQGDVDTIRISVGTYHLSDLKLRKVDRIKAIEYCSSRGMAMASFESEEELMEFSKVYPKASECCTSGKDRTGTKRQRQFVWESTGSLIKPSMISSETIVTKFEPTTELCIIAVGGSKIDLKVVDCAWGCSCIICKQPDYCRV